ncbi:MAG TPA: 2Fe-2S iron-sulfur cluster-binding protein [Solirubrobacterales bacterium]|nr:2Fe-2S iron-sulfur cluster-binding protein [Solirubrobacterales bacterium]
MSRLAVQPGERIDRSRPLSFSYDGKQVAGYEGDTIASALYAAGRRIFSRSFKYHRPRGEICGCGQCANSLVDVDGSPGVRACGEPARAGMTVTHLNAWPSLEFDVMSATDRFGGRFTQVGFYYKTFIRPRRLWPVYEKVLRSAAGLGRLRERQAEREWETEYRRRHCDVLVIGGGVAGLAAAARAAELGADVVLCDEDVEPGGALLFEGGHERAGELAEQARAAGVEILSRAAAIGFFDGLVPVVQGSVLHQVRAARTIVAAGTIQQPLVFGDNDLPGVMLSGGARRLGALYGVAPGSTAVVATVDDRGLDDALALVGMGIELRAVADLRADVSGGLLAGRLRDAGVEVLGGLTPARGHGRRALEAITLASPQGGKERRIDCDLLAVSAGAAPALSLALQGGARAEYDGTRAAFRLTELPEGMFAAGSAAGYEDGESAEHSGLLAGAEAAGSLGHHHSGLREEQGKLGGERPAPKVATPPAYSGEGGKAFVDLDEDVTVKDVKQAVAEGFDSLELSKRYTTVTMGPSQGRFSQLPSARLIAAETGLDLETVGLTTARPPWTSVPLGVLAGRPFEAAKRSPVHARHKDLDASVRWAGDWLRAYDYGDPEAETRAVHEGAGVIDVSTLGKLIVRGPQAGELLDRLYPNRISNLAPGRIRYGVLLSDAGRITDDGTICRLDEETFYVTTTSSGAGAVEQWFTWWLADWGLDATVTDVTQGLAAINLAGPRAREILARVTDLDVTNESFSYLDAKQAKVGGVDCLLLRIGFVGELGYEIHCAGAHGQALWDALTEAGADLGVKPFGLEPQRVLRLQKLHIIVGQDTDSESTPYVAAMPWIVKLDKEQEFIGRWALEQRQDQVPPVELVGFRCADGTVPTEGAVVLARNGSPAGEVTSARFSAKVDSVIGMARVPSALAEEGARISISDGDRRIEAVVTKKPFFDPDGEVLRG